MKNKGIVNTYENKTVDLVQRLKQHHLEELQNPNAISIFLCGGNTHDQNILRKELGNRISHIASKYLYTVHYPEDMFTELIAGHHGKDLLTLETILANSVKCVVILLQSPGTFTELGAFANHPILCNKLVVVIDEKHKGNRSFISLGPVRHLKNSTTSKVILTPPP